MKTKEQIEAKIEKLLAGAKDADKKAYEADKNNSPAGRELHQQESWGIRLQAFILSWVLDEK